MPIHSPPVACTITISSVEVGILANVVPPCSVIIVPTGGTVPTPLVIVSIFSGKLHTIMIG